MTLGDWEDIWYVPGNREYYEKQIAMEKCDHKFVKEYCHCGLHIREFVERPGKRKLRFSIIRWAKRKLCKYGLHSRLNSLCNWCGEKI